MPLKGLQMTHGSGQDLLQCTKKIHEYACMHACMRCLGTQARIRPRSSCGKAHLFLGLAHLICKGEQLVLSEVALQRVQVSQPEGIFLRPCLATGAQAPATAASDPGKRATRGERSCSHESDAARTTQV